jgi:hypothetical protein
MARKKKTITYSYTESLEMLVKLQQMAIENGDINLALKAEELKCKIASNFTDVKSQKNNEELTKILVDFINDEQHNSKDTKDIRPPVNDE